jgi:OTU domain-containing protein 5
MKEDGNCLFRSIADQIYGDEEMHSVVRAMCMDYMVKERDHFSQFITEDFDAYITRKREDKCYGNNVEMQAFTEVFGRPIEVYSGRGDAPMNIFNGSYTTDNPPILLSYHGGNHYNSVIDPNNPSVGVGLGLPEYKPMVCCAAASFSN